MGGGETFDRGHDGLRCLLQSGSVLRLHPLQFPHLRARKSKLDPHDRLAALLCRLLQPALAVA